MNKKFKINFSNVFFPKIKTSMVNYYLLLGVTLSLVVVGLVMILSASFVELYAAGGNAYGAFIRQTVAAILGIVLMFVISRIRLDAYKRLAPLLLLVALFVQSLIFTPLGIEVQGSTNWLKIGPLIMQPVELGKLALTLWIGVVLTRQRHLLHRMKFLFFPVIPVLALYLAFVLLGHDLGSAIVILFLVCGAYFVAGMSLKNFVWVGILFTLFTFFMASTGGTRRARIALWFAGCDGNEGLCWQPTHGIWALASGSWFGVGLGSSRSKWSWLPEAHNDYIFAIIGEELGFVGALLVLFLFVLLGLAMVRIASSTDNVFIRIVTGTTFVWILFQALINIAVVIGLLPVLGVPLPFISAGGSSLVTVLAAVGVLLSFVRHEKRLAEKKLENLNRTV